VSTGLAEGFAVLFEAGFIYFLSRKAMAPKHAFAMSLVMNTASFLLPILFAVFGLPWLSL